MRTETTTRTLYTFAELSPKAQARAVSDYAQTEEYHWAESLASLTALAEAFGARLTDYQIDWGNNSYSHVEFSTDDVELTRENLAATLATLGTFDADTLKGHGDCKLTGYCHDESALDGFRAAFHAGESDLNALLQAGFRTWLEACQSDYAYQWSVEAFAQTASMNEWEFTADGGWVV